MGRTHSKELREAEARNRKAAAENEKLKGDIDMLNNTLSEMRKELSKLQDDLARPVRDREEKVNFVNNLKVPIKVNSSLLILGQKGSGKSTFLYLLGVGPKPEKCLTDGSKEITMSKADAFTDTIGLQWTLDGLFKLMVLLIYKGIPSDLIVCGNDRVLQATEALSLLGINSPLIVMMKPSTLWDGLEEKEIYLVADSNGVMKVNPPRKLQRLYYLDMYEKLASLGVGRGITHEDDIQSIRVDRKTAGLNPFNSLVSKLGATYTAPATIAASADKRLEILFRFLWIYEKKYKGLPQGDLKFMNSCQLSEFEQ